jgi:hypothetical protein
MWAVPGSPVRAWDGATGVCGLARLWWYSRREGRLEQPGESSPTPCRAGAS